MVITPQQENITPEEQTALIELQRYQSIRDGTPIQNLLPPTALTPEITGKPAMPDPGL